jgi:hypothetical protein
MIRNDFSTLSRFSVPLLPKPQDQQTSLTELRLDMVRLRRELADGEARLADGHHHGRARSACLGAGCRAGQVSGLKAALQSAEARAVAAEKQLTVAHKRCLSKQK